MSCVSNKMMSDLSKILKEKLFFLNIFNGTIDYTIKNPSVFLPRHHGTVGLSIFANWSN